MPTSCPLSPEGCLPHVHLVKCGQHGTGLLGLLQTLRNPQTHSVHLHLWQNIQAGSVLMCFWYILFLVCIQSKIPLSLSLSHRVKKAVSLYGFSLLKCPRTTYPCQNNEFSRGLRQTSVASSYPALCPGSCGSSSGGRGCWSCGGLHCRHCSTKEWST